MKNKLLMVASIIHFMGQPIGSFGIYPVGHPMGHPIGRLPSFGTSHGILYSRLSYREAEEC